MKINRRWVRFVVAGLGLALLAGGVAAGVARGQDQSVKPGINKQYHEPNFEEILKRFETDARDIFRKRQEIVAACQLHPGMIVADVGAGTGLFTRLIAPKVVPGGKVYAVDISKKFIEHVEKTCRQQKLDNVVGVVCTDTSTGLPPESVDLVFNCDTYHHFEYPQKMLASIRAALRPAGRLIVIDFKREKGVNPDWVLAHVRTDKKGVISEVTKAGFKLVEDVDVMKEQFLLKFEKQ